MGPIHIAFKTVSYMLYGSVKIGQFIVTTLFSLVTASVSFLNKLLTLLTVIIEDFTIFLKDVIHSVCGILNEISYGCEQIAAAITTSWHRIVQLLQTIHASVSLIYNTGLDGILNLLNGIKNIFVFIKKVIVMFGQGVWFNVVYIPSSLASLILFTITYIQNLCIEIHYNVNAYLKHVRGMILECALNCYHFLTDVPIESLIGIIITLCFLYIFIQFYTSLYQYLRNKTSLLLHGLKIKYNVLKRYANRILTSNSREVVSNESSKYSASTSTKSSDDGSCIICQDEPKCVLVLPCKHLCLCTNCTRRLMRYNSRCPVCRKPINSTMKVFT